VGVLSFLLVLSGTDTASAGTFDPVLKVTVSDSTPEAGSEVTVEFGLEIEHVQFAGVIAFLPADAGVVGGNDIPVGAVVGELDAEATLGIINGGCQTAIPVHFDFLNASLDKSQAVSFMDTDADATPGFGIRDFAEDKDENGILDGIDLYPDFLDRIFGDAQPIRRQASIVPVAGIPVLLQFIVYEPGTTFDLPGEDLDLLLPKDPKLGFPTVVALQNIGDPDPEPEPGAITDFCTPLHSTNTTYPVSKDNEETPDVDESGHQLSANPQNGKYTITLFSVGQRDADGDGWENSLDTCPFIANAGNPKLTGDGDLDQDGLDSACDPNDDPLARGSNSDEDGDGYLNRHDNCPIDQNGTLRGGTDEDNQNDDDFDSIGNACDPDPDKPDGDLLDGTRTAELVFGDGTGPGGPPSAKACPRCVQNVGENVITPSPADGGGTPAATKTGDGDSGGSSTGLIVGIVVVAAVVVLGGGAFVAMRRRGGG
jgi:hypothetical protein